MNILFLNLYDIQGGAETIFNLCYKECIRKHNCYQFVLAGDSEKSGKISSVMKKRTFFKLQGILLQFPLFKDLIMWYSLLRILYMVKRYKIDVIHLHNTHDFLISIKGIEILLQFVPVVWTFHDMWGMTGHCAYSSKCARWKEGCRICESLSEYPSVLDNCTARLFEKKRSLFKKDNIYRVCPSEWLYHMVEESGMGKKNLCRIPNGVDLTAFKRLDKKKARKYCGLDENKKYLLFVAASLDNKKKGMNYLLGALKMLQEIKDLELLITGGLCNAIPKSKIPVHQFGYISDRKDVNELYSAADLFVLPSIEDNFPCTTLEAMASGTPVIAFGIGGITEQLQDEAGFLVKEISSTALAEGIRDALMDDERRYKIMENAYEKCLELYSAQKMGDSYSKLYKKASGRFKRNR